MADHEIASGGSGDDVAQLVALTERQHELWALLRDAQDEQVRNSLFDELTANREELARIKDAVNAQIDPSSTAEPPPPAVDRASSAPAESPQREQVAPPTPPPPPPPTVPVPVVDLPEQVEPETFAIETVEPDPVPPPVEPARPEPAIPAVEPTPPPTSQPEDPVTRATGKPTGLAPEEKPFRSRADDLAATRGTTRGEAKQQAPRPVANEILDERRRSAHEAYQVVERVRPHRSRSFPVFAVVVAILAVAASAWYIFVFTANDDPVAATTTTTVAPTAPSTDVVGQIEAVLGGLGLGTIAVNESGDTIVLVGAVGSEQDRNAVIGASQALAGEREVDAAGLVIAVQDGELRTEVLKAIATAGFDKINVSVSGGVATLTGVTPDDGATELVAAVSAVDGISQVVNLTESFDRSAALSGELERITAVTPIVFASGQTDLNALQERILDSAAEIILAYDGPIVTIVGYTDAAGGVIENQQISLTRAERVRDYLVANGVSSERLLVEGRGEADASGSAAVAGLERRVEFEVGYAVDVGSGDFRIGIVAPSARNDLAFTQSIVDAVGVIAAERGGIGIDISDGLFVTDDAEAALRSYAADGYDLVIAHGSQYGTSLAALAPEFPETAFAWGTAADTFDLPNVSAYEVSADQGGYVMGVVAGLVTESDVIGVVGPLEVGDAQLYVNGFSNGVASANPGADVRVIYTGSFSDVALAAGAASAHVEAGADVLTGTAQMVVGAVGVASENGAAWFGTQANQTELEPNLVVASQVYHWEVALRQIIAGIDQGVLGGETYTLTLANGGLVIEYNTAYPLDTGTVETADAITANIIAGTVITGG